jgi:hypothetical protein
MAAPQAIAFQAVLTCMGFTNPTINALAANGINTTQDLIGLNEKDVEQILKIIRTGPPPMVVPYIAQKRLNIFSYWVSWRHQLDKNTDAGEYL